MLSVIKMVFCPSAKRYIRLEDCRKCSDYRYDGEGKEYCDFRFFRNRDPLVNYLSAAEISVLYNLLSERYHKLQNEPETRKEEIFLQIEALYMRFKRARACRPC